MFGEQSFNKCPLQVLLSTPPEIDNRGSLKESVEGQYASVRREAIEVDLARGGRTQCREKEESPFRWVFTAER